MINLTHLNRDLRNNKFRGVESDDMVRTWCGSKEFRCSWHGLLQQVRLVGDRIQPILSRSLDSLENIIEKPSNAHQAPSVPNPLGFILLADNPWCNARARVRGGANSSLPFRRAHLTSGCPSQARVNADCCGGHRWTCAALHGLLSCVFLEEDAQTHPRTLSDTGSRNSNSSVLTWQQRPLICLGIARGLAYLHEELQPTMIHRDIKAQNILLDKDCRFRTRPTCSNREHCNHAQHGCNSVVSGRRWIENELPPEPIYIRVWALTLCEEGKLLNMVDKKLKGDYNEVEILLVLKTALASLVFNDIPRNAQPCLKW